MAEKCFCHAVSGSKKKFIDFVRAESVSLEAET